MKVTRCNTLADGINSFTEGQDGGSCSAPELNTYPKRPIFTFNSVTEKNCYTTLNITDGSGDAFEASVGGSVVDYQSMPGLTQRKLRNRVMIGGMQ